MKNLIFPLSAWLYRKYNMIFKTKRNPKLQKTLQVLNPMENVDKLYEDFQVRRLTLAISVLGIGIVFAMLLHLSSRVEGKLAEGAQLVRNEWGAGDYQVTLHAKTGEWSREIPFQVGEREFTEEERSRMQRELQAALPDLIKKENEDLAHVSGDLELLSSVPGYPFRLTWSSSDSDLISRNGQVDIEGLGKEGKSVDLTVILSDGQERCSFTYTVKLLPEEVSEEESFYRALKESLLQTDLESKSQREIFLPRQLLGKVIEWEEARPDNSGLIFLLFLLGSLMAGVGMERDLEQSRKKRDKELILDYPGFVSKLRLYMSAGLTVKNAFFKVAADYRAWAGQGKCRYLYEEMKIACHRLENNVAEEQVYQEFGKRCGEMRYRRLSFLLAVHLKQGNSQLLMLLAKEADDAQEDRKNLARKAGEEAGTKLLLPMLLMLVVVMLLVLLPAYLDFGSI